ncbi:MAG: GlsB/YeaQ/YmgE family stress response membrane protein [Oscillochloris sp.]|nr:GlsB/YeaQ/YmgE family stress response membrane protein [Oscillochloris sp.]
MNLILWILFGALVGWLASIVMRTDAQQGALLNIVVGIIGAFLGGLVFSLLGFGGSNINSGDFSLGSLLVSFIGAVVLLGIVNLFRRGSVR